MLGGLPGHRIGNWIGRLILPVAHVGQNHREESPLALELRLELRFIAALSGGGLADHHQARTTPLHKIHTTHNVSNDGIATHALHPSDGNILWQRSFAHLTRRDNLKAIIVYINMNFRAQLKIRTMHKRVDKRLGDGSLAVAAKLDSIGRPFDPSFVVIGANKPLGKLKQAEKIGRILLGLNDTALAVPFPTSCEHARMAHQAFVGEEGSCIGKATPIPRYKTERGGIGIIHIPKRALVEGRAQMRETAPLHGNPRIACIPRIVHAHKDKLHQTFPGGRLAAIAVAYEHLAPPIGNIVVRSVLIALNLKHHQLDTVPCIHLDRVTRHGIDTAMNHPRDELHLRLRIGDTHRLMDVVRHAENDLAAVGVRECRDGLEPAFRLAALNSLLEFPPACLSQQISAHHTPPPLQICHNGIDSGTQFLLASNDAFDLVIERGDVHLLALDDEGSYALGKKSKIARSSPPLSPRSRAGEATSPPAARASWRPSRQLRAARGA